MFEENNSKIKNDSTKSKSPLKKRSASRKNHLYSEPKPVCYIGSGNNCELIVNLLKSVGYENDENRIDDFKFKWVQCSYQINWNLFKDGEQMVNHIQGEDYFTNKLQLYQSLQTYENTCETIVKRPFIYLTLQEYLPQTFKLDEKHDRDILFHLHQDGDLWICKPSGLNQGKGIYLVRDINQLKDKYQSIDSNDKFKTYSMKQNKIIVQRYIKNPLLIHRKKFDIRCYMLISNVQPLIVLYHHGYIRLSMFDFDQNDDNLLTHLTNQYMQKKDSQYDHLKEDTAWTMEQLNDYFNQYILPNKNLPPDWIYLVLPKIICRIMLNVIESIRMRLKRRLGCFGLYGYDFMIDDNLKVWLIEINVNPALSTNTKTLLEVIPPIVQESILISMECFQKMRHNENVFPLKSLKGFQCIYNELEKKHSLPLIKAKRAFSSSIHFNKFISSSTSTSNPFKSIPINDDQDKSHFIDQSSNNDEHEQKVPININHLRRSRTNYQIIKSSKVNQEYFNQRSLTPNHRQRIKRSKSLLQTSSKCSTIIESIQPLQT